MRKGERKDLGCHARSFTGLVCSSVSRFEGPRKGEGWELSWEREGAFVSSAGVVGSVVWELLFEGEST